MKKKLFLIFILIVLIIFSVCKKKPAFDKNELSIVTSFYPMYISAINITKDIPDVKVINLAKPQTGCLHDYQLTTDDMIALEKADIFIANGAGMESFLSKVISQLPKLKVIEASKNIRLIKNNLTEDDFKNIEENELDYNPHIWVSITLCIEQVKNITKELSVLDNKNSVKYEDNAKIYIDKLDKLKFKMHNKLDNIKNKNIITFHEAFPYFAREFNFNIVSVIEREPGSEPSAKDLSDTITLIKSNNVKALFAEPQYPSKAADTIAKETSLKVYILDPSVTGEMTEDAYLNIMEKNLIVLEEALK